MMLYTEYARFVKLRASDRYSYENLSEHIRREVAEIDVELRKKQRNLFAYQAAKHRVMAILKMGGDIGWLMPNLNNAGEKLSIPLQAAWKMPILVSK